MLAANSSSGGGRKAKKFVIQKFRTQPKLPASYEEDTWEKLRGAVGAIHKGKPVQESLEELYKAVEGLCLHKFSERLFSRLQQVCTEHVEKQFSALQATDSFDTLSFLKSIQTLWNNHCSQTKMIRSIFLYLDRTHVVQTSKVRSLWEMGLVIFCEHLKAHTGLLEKVVKGLQELIELERNGEDLEDPSLLNSLLKMLTSLQIYGGVFEEEFLARSEAYYARLGAEKMQTLSVGKYLEEADRRLKEENIRVERYLNERTRVRLISLVESNLVGEHAEALLARGLKGLLEAKELKRLELLYKLFQRVEKLDAVRVGFSKYIEEKGQALVTDESQDKHMVQKLLELKDVLDEVVRQSFHSKQPFFYAVKEAFEKFVNKRKNKPAELVAKFLDAELRKKSVNDHKLDKVLDKVMTLFRCIQGKDVFEAFYKKDLARRLLLGRSASIDNEKLMIGKLKNECGHSFTNKLEGMFKDIDLSKELMIAYRTQAQPSPVELNVFVLTSGNWPTYPLLEVSLPASLSSLQDAFNNFYLQKHQGRRLAWQNTLGQCLLRAKFKSKNHQIMVSLFQTVVLLLFNRADTLTFKEIAKLTGLEGATLKRQLQSLACGRYRVLTKQPKSKLVSDSDSFHFNADFKQAKFRIGINEIQARESAEDDQKTAKEVTRDRKPQIEAAIVRVMKTKKTITHNQLHSELLEQLKFHITPMELKSRIGSLIDRDYMEPDPADPHTYHYIA